MTRIDTSSLVRADLGDNDRAELERRAKALGVRVMVRRSIRRKCWRVYVASGPHHIDLYGAGPVAAVIAGALADFEEAMVAA